MNAQPPTTSTAQLIQTSEDEGGLQLGQLVGALRRKALLIAGITTIVAVLAQFRVATDKPVYSAGFEILTKSVTVESEVISSVPDTLSNRQQQTATQAGVLDETKIRVLLSPSLLYPIVEQLQPKHPDLDYGTLAANLAILPDSEDILTVTYSSEDPRLVKDVLDIVSEAYLRYSLEERQKDVSQGIEFVQDQLPDLETRVAAQQEKLEQFRQTYNLIDPDTQASLLSNQAGTLAQQRSEAETQLNEARSLYGELHEQIDRQSAESAASSALSNSPRYQKLLDQLLEIDTKIAQDSSLYLEGSLEMQVLQEQRQSLLPLLQREGRRVEAELASQIQELESRTQALAQANLALNQNIQQLSTITRQYTDIQRELQVATENLNQFLAKREALRIDAAQREVPWQLLTPPGDPQPSSASSKRSLALGTILGLLLGVGAALALDRLSNVIHTSKELKDAANLPLLGVIPFSQSLGATDAPDEIMIWLQSAGLQVGHDRPFAHSNHSPFLEAFRALAVNIRMSSPDARIRSIAISSAVPNSGKTTIAFYLAQAVAGMGQRVLLVDTDLRRPSVHYRLGLSDTAGLTDVISGGLALEEAAQQMPWESNLFVLPAGTIPPDPARILSSQAMKSLITQSHEAFDLVIFDTPPLLGLADTYLFANCTDGLLLVVRLHQLKRALLEQTLEDLRVSGAPVLGTIANASNERTMNLYSYYNAYAQPDSARQPDSISAKALTPQGRLQDFVSKVKQMKNRQRSQRRLSYLIFTRSAVHKSGGVA
ncbi:MAG: polysaccharide biosynthesis tyrosine autokinase [Leptolyngbyaceae cyanobacterium SM1_3_5]|nr:polysaccharide biosynthesis tyrosine autokinase [Leptolyngbyaceae cyanobacterium SM1_3_5]